MAVQLVSVEDVRLQLQKQTGETGSDPVLGRLIEAASEQVLNFTEREFAPVSTSTSRQFYYCGDGILDLAPYDIQASPAPVVKIDTVDGAGGTTLTAGTHYRLYPLPAKDGVKNWLRLAASLPASAPSAYFDDREVTITGTWGFPSVPDDVKYWTTVTVVDWFRERVAAFGTRFNPETEALEVPEDLPAAARSGLKRYRMNGR